MKIIIALLLTILPFLSFAASLNEPLTIEQAHELMQKKQLTAVQLVSFYLNRIKQFDQSKNGLNAVVQLNKNALSQAEQLDDDFQAHGFKGPLHGIPILLKDNIDTIDGMANTAGSIALRHNFPKQDAFLVTQLKKAGAIIYS